MTKCKASCGFVSLAGSIVLLFVCSSIYADPFIFTKIADTNTAIPEGVGNFRSFGIPSIDGQNIAFSGNGGLIAPPDQTSEQSGVYAQVGGTFKKLIDKSSQVDNGTGSFFSIGEGFTSVQIKGGDVASLFKPNSSPHHVFTLIDGSLTQGSVGEGGGGTIDAEILAWVRTGGDGIFTTANGTVTPLVVRDDPFPDGMGVFRQFGEVPVIVGQEVVFRGGSNDKVFPTNVGIYKHSQGMLSTIVDLNTMIPGGTGSFTSIGQYWFDGNSAIFVGEGTAGQKGIFIDDGTGLVPVVTRDTVIPDGTGTLMDFDGLSVDADRIVFLAEDPNGESIYTISDGVLSKVIGTNNILDNKMISGLLFDGVGLSGDAIAFKAEFTDGSEGVFTVTIPEPTSSALLGIGLMLISPLRRVASHRRNFVDNIPANVGH